MRRSVPYCLAAYQDLKKEGWHLTGPTLSEMAASSPTSANSESMLLSLVLEACLLRKQQHPTV
eukprot:6195425-Pleurochrysis_carterae.AAC.2